MSDAAGQTNSNDESLTAHPGAHMLVNRIEMPRPSPWREPAVYIAILAVIVVVGGEWRRWVALDEKITEVKQSQHDYYEEINVWETDTFNRQKDVDSFLRANFGIDPDRLFGKAKPPPVPKEK